MFLLQYPIPGSDFRYLTTYNSFNYKLPNLNNFSEGLIYYYTSSEPFTEECDKTYKTIDVEYNLTCDQQVTSPDFDIHFTFYESSLGLIEASCPTIAPSLIPAPEYLPECGYSNRIDYNTRYGINGNLNALNH